jgi:dienelactone hydrolase
MTPAPTPLLALCARGRPFAFAALACLALAGCVSLVESTAELGALSAAQGGAAGPQGVKNEDGSELWLIPASIPGLLLRASLFSPPGAGPFRLAVVSHGSEQDPARRANLPMPAFPVLTDWLLKRNYAVLVPQRPGHGATGGRYLEDQGACRAADYVAAGNGAADSIEAAIGYVVGQPMIRPAGVLVVGNSAGGWGSIALAARNLKEVSGVVVFAAGRGGRDRGRADSNCLPERLVAAAGVFGRTARIPTLWLYAENDTYFAPELSSDMAAAFRQGGGDVTYRLLPPLRTGEGHGLIDVPGDPPVWAAELEKFLAGKP